MTTYITQEQVMALFDKFPGAITVTSFDLCNAAIQAYRENLTAGVVLPEPVGWTSPRAIANLSDERCGIFCDDSMRCIPIDVALYTADQLRQAIADALAKQVTQSIHVTEDMHIAAVEVLHRANGLDGLPQRMMDAMLAAAPDPKEAV